MKLERCPDWWPIGGRELAKLLGVKETTVQQWRFRRVLPSADYTVNGMDAWRLETILQWAEQTGRPRRAPVARLE